MKSRFLFIFVICFINTTYAQVGIGTTSPDTSTILDVVSNNKGILIPRLTSTQRIAISSPANGLMLFDTTTNSFWYYKQTQWVEIETSQEATLADLDSDTKIDVEKTTDEDVIHFDIKGTEQWTMTKNRLEAINSGESVFIGLGTGTNDDLSNNQNVFIGNNAGLANTSGNKNTFIGYEAGTSNTTAFENTFIGHQAGKATTTGIRNTFIGKDAGLNTTTGYGNVFVGIDSGDTNTTGFWNTFMGINSGISNSSGNQNVFIGGNSGFTNTTGYWNTFMGFGAGKDNTTAHSNTFIGLQSGEKTTTGNSNTFVGLNSGRFNTTGVWNTFMGVHAGMKNTTAHSNTAIGFQAGENTTTGNNNTSIGLNSARFNTTGRENTVLGAYAGEDNTTGIRNTFIGKNAGQKNELGGSNAYLGYQSGINNEGSNNVFIGAFAGAAETITSNTLFIDNSNTAYPLIHGDFSTNELKVHGALSIANPTTGTAYYKFPTGDGVANQILTTDGAGTISWVGVENTASVAFAANWSDYNNGFTAGRYYKNNERVTVEGVIVKSTAITSGDIMLTLPLGYRPASKMIFLVSSANGPVSLEIDTTGNIIINTAFNVSQNWVSLSGISFRLN